MPGPARMNFESVNVTKPHALFRPHLEANDEWMLSCDYCGQLPNLTGQCSLCEQPFPIVSATMQARQWRREFERSLLTKKNVKNEKYFSDFFLNTMVAIFLITRSEEHTSELRSPCNLVCRL